MSATIFASTFVHETVSHTEEKPRNSHKVPLLFIGSHFFPLQCGTASSCVKISRPTNMFDVWGHFVPPDERRPPETLFRGCFVLDLKQDICYNARDGLRYCWCSSRDLCNSSPPSLSRVKIALFFSLVGQNVKAASISSFS